MSNTLEQLEVQLDSFESEKRIAAVRAISEMIEAGKVEVPEAGMEHNLHFHTFFSYNARGYSPSRVAWLARKQGLSVAGIVDFDVLDGLEEFYTASELLGQKATVGIETRVFVPEFADKEINSPGEPGISYHMGIGFPTADLGPAQAAFRVKLHETAQGRNRDLMARVNAYLKPVCLDYERDLVPLTPSGNPTERHLCLAYAKKAAEVFQDERKLRAFWVEKLGDKAADVGLPEGGDLQNLIRAKTMKKGGVGYVQPDAGSFPKMKEMNDFALKAGAIPTFTWLNGLSAGEQQIEKLLDVSMSTGAAAINIIPDRNFTPGVGTKDEKCRKLYEVVELAQKLDLPIVVGTEMNSPGLKFVDNFGSEELKPLLGVFYQGACIVYAHCVMQRHWNMGYLSEWAANQFDNTAAKNTFFAHIGENVCPHHVRILREINANMTADEVIDSIRKC